MEFAGRTWTRTPTWSPLMEMGGFDPAAANHGAYAKLVHGTASRPKSKLKLAATPGTPSPMPCGPSPPLWTGKARSVECILALLYQTILALT